MESATMSDDYEFYPDEVIDAWDDAEGYGKCCGKDLAYQNRNREFLTRISHSSRTLDKN